MHFHDFHILFRNMIRALSNWDAHTSATEGEGRCEKFKDCPFMGKMPGLVKISLGGASGGNDNNDDTDKDENDKFFDEDELESDAEDEVENTSCKKFCCFF